MLQDMSWHWTFNLGSILGLDDHAFLHHLGSATARKMGNTTSARNKANWRDLERKDCIRVFVLHDLHTTECTAT